MKRFTFLFSFLLNFHSDDLKQIQTKDTNLTEGEIKKIRSQLQSSIAASHAHQSHSRLLNLEIQRIENEKEKAIQVKNATITRMQKTIAELQIKNEEMRSTILSSQKRSASPLRKIQSPALEKVPSQLIQRSISKSSNADVEELKSQLECLKKEYFNALLIGCKLQRLMNEQEVHMKPDLYSIMEKQNVNWLRWGEWINAQLDIPD
jgi:hypothetical protein